MQKWFAWRSQLDVLVYRARFMRVVPRAFAVLALFVRHRRKKRYAWWLGTLPCCRRAFFRWRDRVASGELHESGAARLALQYRHRRTRLQRVAAMHASEERLAAKANLADTTWQADQAWRITARQKAMLRSKEAIVARQIFKERMELTAGLRESMHSKFQAVTSVVDSFLRDRTARVKDIVEVCDKGVKELTLSHGRIMHDVLVAGFEAMEQAAAQRAVRVFFNSLRSRYIRRVATAMHNRARLRRWLRICNRLIFLERHMVVYRRMRVKWNAFSKCALWLMDLCRGCAWANVFALLPCLSRWFKHTVARMTHTTPGLKDTLRRQREALGRFGRFIEAKSPEDAAQAACSLHGTLLRWAEFASIQRAIKGIVTITRSLHAISVKRWVGVVPRVYTWHLCFWSLHHGACDVPYGCCFAVDAFTRGTPECGCGTCTRGRLVIRPATPSLRWLCVRNPPSLRLG